MPTTEHGKGQVNEVTATRDDEPDDFMTIYSRVMRWAKGSAVHGGGLSDEQTAVVGAVQQAKALTDLAAAVQVVGETLASLAPAVVKFLERPAPVDGHPCSSLAPSLVAGRDVVRCELRSPHPGEDRRRGGMRWGAMVVPARHNHSRSAQEAVSVPQEAPNAPGGSQAVGKPLSEAFAETRARATHHAAIDVLDRVRSFALAREAMRKAPFRAMPDHGILPSEILDMIDRSGALDDDTPAGGR